jgi:hypothetical protein
MDLVLTLVCCVSVPDLVCTFWLCTSLDVEAGLCNPLSKKNVICPWNYRAVSPNNRRSLPLPTQPLAVCVCNFSPSAHAVTQTATCTGCFAHRFRFWISTATTHNWGQRQYIAFSLLLYFSVFPFLISFSLFFLFPYILFIYLFTSLFNYVFSSFHLFHGCYFSYSLWIFSFTHLFVFCEYCPSR